MGSFDELKKKRLCNALKKVSGNRTLAAEALGVSVRTIRNWINKFDLSKQFPPVHGRKKP